MNTQQLSQTTRRQAFFERRLSLKEKVFVGILSFLLFSLAGLIDWKKIAKTEQLGDCIVGEAVFTLMKKDCKKGAFTPYTRTQAL